MCLYLIQVIDLWRELLGDCGIVGVESKIRDMYLYDLPSDDISEHVDSTKIAVYGHIVTKRKK